MARRPNPTARDMIVALLVLLAPVLLISWWFTRIPEPTVTKVELVPVLAVAQAESPYRLAVPANLPDSWTCVRARWTAIGQPGLDGQPARGNTWRLGYLTPDRMYLGIDQRDQAGDSLVAEVTRKGSADGSSDLGGKTWQRWISPDGRTRALVLADPASTVVLSGDVGYAELEGFAATLGG